MPHRRIGFITPNPDKDQENFDVTIGPEFPDNLWDEFDRIVQVLPELRPFVIDYLAVKSDHRQLCELPSSLGALMQSYGNALFSVGHLTIHGYAHIQEVLCNFLYTTACFRDRTKVRLNRLNLTESASFQGLESKLYDSSFAYRLFYNLRNYSAHYDCPVSVIGIKGERTEGALRLSAKFVLQRDKLIENWGKRQARVRDELRQCPEEFDFLPLATEFMKAHDELMLSIIESRNDRLADYERYILAVRRTLNVPADSIPMVFENLAETGLEFNTTTVGFSEDEFRILVGLHTDIKAALAS